MTAGAALFFVILLACTTRAVRWLTRNREWPLAAITLAGLASLVALHDATVTALAGYRDATHGALALPASPWSATDVYAWLDRGAPGAGDDRWPAMRAALAQAGDADAADVNLPGGQLSRRRACVGSELAGILAGGISDARGAMAEDLVSQPCWAPGVWILQPR